jgi:NAD(P)-dependent dehydrogenase (short-subunit alcohol dehydrogenase family)
MNNLNGRVFAVTGAGSGIGRALAVGLARKGAKLVLADRNDRGLIETCRLLGNAPVAHKVFDVTDADALSEFCAQAVSEFGRLDGMINNAGLSIIVPFAQMEREDFGRVMAVNFEAVVEGCRVALPYLQNRSERTWLVNISSIFGIMPFETQTAYCASKFAVRGFTETLRVELQQSDPNIDVVCVHPGGIKTAVIRNAKIVGMVTNEASNMMTAENFEKVAPTTPEQAAHTIIRALERGKLRVRIGPDARLVDWLVRLMPVSAPRILAGLLRMITRIAVR